MANYQNSIWTNLKQQYPSYAGAYAGLVDPDFGEEKPDAAYSLWRQYQKQSNPYQNWLRNQQNKYYSDYMGATYLEPGLMWQDYLQALKPDLDFRTASPYERGERPSAFATRSRWVGF